MKLYLNFTIIVFFLNLTSFLHLCSKTNVPSLKKRTGQENKSSKRLPIRRLNNRRNKTNSSNYPQTNSSSVKLILPHKSKKMM